MLFISLLILLVVKAIPLISTSAATHFTRICAIILLLSGILSFNISYIQSIGSGIGLYSGLFQVTNISQTIEIFIFIIGFIVLMAWPLSANHNQENINKYAIDYSIIVLFSTMGSSLLVSSFDLISIYLSIELQSFGLYILSTLYRNSEASTGAGLKYFLLGGFSSCIILLGAGLIYAYTGSTQLESIYTLLSSLSSSNFDYVIQGTLLGIILMIIGLLFKVAAAPFHNWAPSVYDETPTIVTIWLTIMPKIAIFVLLLELYAPMNLTTYYTTDSLYYQSFIDFACCSALAEQLGTNFPFADSFTSYYWAAISFFNIDYTALEIKNILLISSMLSLIVGVVVGLAQVKIKRLLAYSTISHVGFILLALAINTEYSIDAFLFYIIQYIVTSLNIFFILLAISYLSNTLSNKRELVINDVKYLKDLQGLFFSNPALSLTLSICLFSMAGIPPLLGFFGKLSVLTAALEQGYDVLSYIAIITSVISATYYLKIVKLMHTEDNNNTIVTDNSTVSVLTSTHSFVISTLSLLILFFILKPTLILTSTQVLSLYLFNY